MSEHRKMLTWVVPTTYNRFRIDREVACYIRDVRSALLRVGLPSYGLCLCVLGFVFAKSLLPLGVLVKAIIAIPIAVIWLTGGLVVPYWLTKFCVQQVKITQRGLRFGWDTVALRQVNRYRLTDVDEFPDLRALEIEYSSGGGHKRSAKLAFDPAEMDEGLIASFMGEILPDKLRADS